MIVTPRYASHWLGRGSVHPANRAGLMVALFSSVSFRILSGLFERFANRPRLGATGLPRFTQTTAGRRAR